MTTIDLTAQLNEMYANGVDYDFIMREANDIAEKNRWLVIGDKQRTGHGLYRNGNLITDGLNVISVRNSNKDIFCLSSDFVLQGIKETKWQDFNTLDELAEYLNKITNLVSEDTCATCLETIPEPLYVIQFLCGKNGWIYTVDSDRNYTYWDYASDGKNLLTSNETEFYVSEDGSEEDNINQ